MDFEEVVDDLYRRGYSDGRKERDYDPRGCLEWQNVVELLEQQQTKISMLSSALKIIHTWGTVKDPQGDAKNLEDIQALALDFLKRFGDVE